MLDLIAAHYEVRVFIPQEEPAGPETAYVGAREILFDEDRHVLLLDPAATTRQDINLVRRGASAGLHGWAFIPASDWGLSHWLVVHCCLSFVALCAAQPNGPTPSQLRALR